MNPPRSDGELLTAFTGRADQTAFAALVERHGPMVVRAAEAILRDRHGAEDVAQAAFLVLAQKAAGLRKSETVAPWLHRVAWRLAIDELRRRQSRQRREEENVRMNTPASPADLAAIHEELGGLPDRYRSALVLCYLEGEPPEAAARHLGLRAAALRKRLERARELLRKKLVRRGVAVGALSAVLAAEAGAATLPVGFVATTVQAATSLAGTATVTPIVFGGTILKTKLILAGAFVAVIVGTGIYLAASDAHRAAAAPARPPAARQQPPAPAIPLTPTGSSPVIASAPNPTPLFASVAELEAVLQQLLLIADDADRLAALRHRLGMNLPAAVYQQAVTTYANRANPKKLFELILLGWTETEPRAAILWARRLPPEVRDQFSAGLLAYWLQRDRDSARAFARDQLTPEMLALAETGSFKMNAATSPLQPPGNYAELIRQAESDADPQMSHTKLLSAVGRWAEQDPRAAADYALAISPEKFHGVTRMIGLASTLCTWTDTDPDAALAWAKAVPSAADRIEAVAVVLPGWARKHPDEVVDVSFLPVEKQSAVIQQVATEWRCAVRRARCGTR